MEKFELQPNEKYEREAIFLIPIEKIRVSENQERKVSRDKIDRHKKFLMEHEEQDLLPIDAYELEDGTFIIYYRRQRST